jgi:hypothetical protein
MNTNSFDQFLKVDGDLGQFSDLWAKNKESKNPVAVMRREKGLYAVYFGVKKLNDFIDFDEAAEYLEKVLQSN